MMFPANTHDERRLQLLFRFKIPLGQISNFTACVPSSLLTNSPDLTLLNSAQTLVLQIAICRISWPDVQTNFPLTWGYGDPALGAKIVDMEKAGRVFWELWCWTWTWWKSGVGPRRLSRCVWGWSYRMGV